MCYTLKAFYKELEKEDLLYYEDILDCLKEYSPKLKNISENNFLEKKLKITNQEKIKLLNQSATKMVETVRVFKCFMKEIESIFAKEGYYCNEMAYGYYPLTQDEEESIVNYKDFYFVFDEFVFTFNKDFSDFKFYIKNNLSFFEGDGYSFITGENLNGHIDYEDNKSFIKIQLKKKLEFIDNFYPNYILKKIKKIDPKPLFNMMNDYELLVEKITEHIY